MIIFKKAYLLSEYLLRQKKQGSSIGFVPTMGALHEGHLSLIHAARSGNEIAVCSIFVNPTQFNNANDYQHYPITIEHDIEQLTGAGCEVLFLPPPDEIYPPGYHKKHYALGDLETRLEGHYRPGHFQGVCEVVDRLLQIIAPDRLYLGQKDFQQCMVIKKLITLLGKENEIALNIVPTKRESSGLAMSSRNLRLSAPEKALAASIASELEQIREKLGRQPIAALEQAAASRLEAKGFSVDYVAVAHASDLSPARDASVPLVALAAASIGKVRLIDNLLLNREA